MTRSTIGTLQMGCENVGDALAPSRLPARQNILSLSIELERTLCIGTSNMYCSTQSCGVAKQPAGRCLVACSTATNPERSRKHFMVLMARGKIFCTA